MASANQSSGEIAQDQPVAQPSSPAVEQHLSVSQEVEPLEGQENAQFDSEDKAVQELSEVSRYPSISSQVLQNVKDLKEEILNGQHATVSAPQDADAEDEENEEQVDVVLKSFEIKREDERQEVSQDKQPDTVEKPQSPEADEGAGLKRDAQSMLNSDKDQSAQPSSTGAAVKSEGRDPKRARYEQDQDQKARTAINTSSAGSNVDVTRKSSVSESRAPHTESQAAPTRRPRSPPRIAAEQRGPPSDGRSLDPRNSRSYNDDRFSNSNRSGLSTYTDRLSSNSSRRDQERDRMEQVRTRGEPPYEQRSDRDYRDRERFERGSNDRRDFERPPPLTDKEPKLSLRDRIEGIPPARRSSPPLSAASGGASGKSTTKYSKPPVPLNAAGHPIREPVRDDPRDEYDNRRSASGRDRYDGPAGPPGHDNRAVSRTSSMPERITDSRSFPPKNSTSYSDVKGSAPPSSRPTWEEQSRNSPPPSSAGTRYSQPASTYRSKEPPRSNPNVVYSRPPVPRDSVLPPSATRGSSPPPRRGYEAPSPASGRSAGAPRDYAYGGSAASAPEPHVARSTYDRYGAPAPPADPYRNDSRGSDYRAPPPVEPPSGRSYPSAGLPPVAVDPYAHPSYDRQPPQYDRYGRPIPLDQGPPASYAPPPVARSAPVYAAPPPVSDVDAELEGLKLRLLELERRREAERDAEIARTMPRSFQSGPPVSHMPIETGYGGRGESINNGRGYVPRERERERERVTAGGYPLRNPPSLADRREPAHPYPRREPPPGDFSLRDGPVYRASSRRSPPPMSRDDRSRR